jgi:long-chain acyl-CoA synthetase
MGSEVRGQKSEVRDQSAHERASKPGQSAGPARVVPTQSSGPNENPIDWLLHKFAAHPSSDAIIWRDQSTTYQQLLDRIDDARKHLGAHGLKAGEIVLLDADFSPAAIAMLLACMAHRVVIVPIASHVTADRNKLADIAQATRSIRIDQSDQYRFATFDREVTHPLLKQIQELGAPGLILFSSGSSGEPKASLHNLEFLLNKFKISRHTQRMITFLLFDHIGGFNTLMYTLANHGCVITLESRDPEIVCRTIAKHRAEVLPTSPTFLRLMLMSGAHLRHDMSSVKVINYATEVMPQATLKALHDAFPNIELRQSYGLSELGILRSQSRSSDSLWVRVGGEDYQTRVVDGVLQIKAKSSMMGYLNAPSAFTEDGWFDTQDEVEMDGEWLRFKGRRSSIINVGGEKVYPEEVETVILEVDNVIDATVTKEPHPFTGNIVVASVQIRDPEDVKQVAARIRKHCFTKLPSFKVPVKITLANSSNVSERFKKKRRIEQPQNRGDAEDAAEDQA